MKKPAAASHPIHEPLQHRWSPRAFSEEPVSAELLRSLFEAARWAASSYNQQPWAFLVATKDDKAAYDKILSTLMEFNQAWAKSAPVVGIAVSQLAFSHNGQPNRNAFYDTGAAMAQLSTEATTRGLAVHQMGGFDAAKATQVLGIPEGWQPIAAFTIGYPGDPDSLPEQLREREKAPRERKPLEAFVMGAEWNKPAAFLKR